MQVNLIYGFTPSSSPSTYKYISATNLFNTFNNITLPGSEWTNPVDIVSANARFEAPLPVEIMNFTASRLDDQMVKVNWTVGVEQNLKEYEIERKFENEPNFNKINAVEANGYPSYSQNDNNHFTGISYYRLKMINLDGSFKYSKIVTVNGIINQPSLSIYPNPSAGIFNISTTNFTNAIEIKVTDLVGKVIVNQQVEANTITNLNLENQTKGIYLFHLKSGNFETTQKLNLE